METSPRFILTLQSPYSRKTAKVLLWADAEELYIPKYKWIQDAIETLKKDFCSKGVKNGLQREQGCRYRTFVD